MKRFLNQIWLKCEQLLQDIRPTIYQSAEERRLVHLVDFSTKKIWKRCLQVIVISALQVARSIVAMSCRIVCICSSLQGPARLKNPGLGSASGTRGRRALRRQKPRLEDRAQAFRIQSLKLGPKTCQSPTYGPARLRPCKSLQYMLPGAAGQQDTR